MYKLKGIRSFRVCSRWYIKYNWTKSIVLFLHCLLSCSFSWFGQLQLLEIFYHRISTPTNSRIGNCTYLPVQCSHNLTDIPNHDYQCTLAHTKRFNMKLQLFFVVSLFLTFHPHLLHPVFDIHTDELTKKRVSEYLAKCCGTCTVLPPGGGGNWPRSMWATLIFKIHLANKKSHPSNRRVLVFGVRTCSEAHKRIPHSLFPPVLR